MASITTKEDRARHARERDLMVNWLLSHNSDLSKNVRLKKCVKALKLKNVSPYRLNTVWDVYIGRARELQNQSAPAPLPATPRLDAMEHQILHVTRNDTEDCDDPPFTVSLGHARIPIKSLNIEDTSNWRYPYRLVADGAELKLTFRNLLELISEYIRYVTPLTTEEQMFSNDSCNFKFSVWVAPYEPTIPND